MMKKSLPLFLALTLVVGTLIYTSTQSTESVYQERAELQVSQSAHGGAAIRKSGLVDPETGEVDFEAKARVESYLAKMPANRGNKNLDIDWVSAGPNNIGGRTRALMAYEEDPQRMMVGGISGGVYRSENGGSSWTRVDSFNQSLIVSSIVRDGSGRIYVGMGNAFEGDFFRGDGLYASLDDGETWNIVQDFSPTTQLSSAGPWFHVNDMYADPIDPDKIWIAHSGGISSYVWGDEDVVEHISDTGFALDISQDGEVIIASSGTQVYVSTDNGVNFTNVSGNGFGQIPVNSGRTEVAVSPDDPDFMYTVLVTPSGSLRAVYASLNRGQQWYRIFADSNGGSNPFSPFGDNAQGIYDCCLAVVPGEPTRVILGGIRMYEIQMTETLPPSAQQTLLNLNFVDGPNPLYVHSDIHSFFFASNDDLIIGTDGGIFRSQDAVNTFQARNFNYRTTQFYGADFNNNGGMLAGAQDNGTHLITGLTVSTNQSVQVQGGDGFDCRFSRIQDGMAFATSQFNSVARTTDGGNSGASIPCDEGPFWSVIDMWETIDLGTEEVQIPVGIGFADLIQSYSAGDTLFVDIDADSLILNGGYVSDGDTVVFEEDFDLMGLLEDSVHTYSSQSYGQTYTYTNNTGAPIWMNNSFTAIDPAQSLFVVGNSGYFQITRDATKTSISTSAIQFDRIDISTIGQARGFAFSDDGDVLYIAGTAGEVWRLDGLSDAYKPGDFEALAETNLVQIYNSNSGVWDLDIDPNDQDRLIICRPGYSNTDKVLVLDNASTVDEVSDFEGIWNIADEISRMPVYSILYDKYNEGRIYAGTEYGVFVTENNGDSWEECNGAMGRVPVYALEQQRLEDEINTGAVYAATYGRGMYFVGDYVLDTEEVNQISTFDAFSIFPNPASDITTLDFDLASSENITIEIYDINGRKVMELPQGMIQRGSTLIEINVSELPEGAFIANLRTESENRAVRFTVVR